MALSGYKEFATGEVLTASDVNAYLMQAIIVFADSTARDSGIPSAKREEGQFVFLKSDNSLQFYDGSSFVSFIGEGDITGVTITTASNSGLAGGASATSGAFSATLVVDPSNLQDGSSITPDLANDLLILEDVTDGSVYKVKPNQIASSSGGAAFSEFLLIGA
jgi:hypothetical protein